VGGKRHAPAALCPGKRPGAHCIGGWVGPTVGLDGCKKSPPPGFDPRTVQPVASRYTDWAIPAHLIYLNNWKFYWSASLYKKETTKCKQTLNRTVRAGVWVWVSVCVCVCLSMSMCGWVWSVFFAVFHSSLMFVLFLLWDNKLNLRSYWFKMCTELFAKWQELQRFVAQNKRSIAAYCQARGRFSTEVLRTPQCETTGTA